MKSYSDEYVNALHAEISQLTKERDAAIEALRPFVKRELDPDKVWALLMVTNKDYQVARRLVVTHDEHRRVDDDIASGVTS